MRIAIITTHPIQYNAPWFKLLAGKAGAEIMVFYTWSQTQAGAKFDPGFGKSLTWDIPLLDGYDYCFVENVARNPGSSHFSGIVNPTLIGQIEKWQPDAILVIGWSFNSHLKAMFHFKGKVPVLFRGDSTLVNRQNILKRSARFLTLSMVYKLVDKALYVGSQNKKYFLKYGLKESQLFFSPHAIDNARFGAPVTAADILAKRKEIGCAEGDFMVLFAGKLEPIKNPFYILEVARLLKEKDIKFVFAGNGDLEASLKEAAKGDSRIVFLDFHNQSAMPLLYACCDLFVLPSFSETWGLALNEVMANSKPVAASCQVGAAVDLIDDSNGLIFDVNDYEALADFIHKLKNDSEKKIAAGLASKERIAHFSFENLVKGILDALN